VNISTLNRRLLLLHKYPSIAPYCKSKLELNSNSSEVLQLIASLPVILLQFKLTKFKLEVLKFDFQRKKEKYNTDKLTINWQNFALVRLQLKIAFIIRPTLTWCLYRYRESNLLILTAVWAIF